MAEFDYKQRPFTKQLTDEQYDRAVGRIKPITRGGPASCPSCGSNSPLIREYVQISYYHTSRCDDVWHNAA